jgi:hypothetical protein
VEKGRQAGADSVILGRTEIGLLISPEHLPEAFQFSLGLKRFDNAECDGIVGYGNGVVLVRDS